MDVQSQHLRLDPHAMDGGDICRLAKVYREILQVRLYPPPHCECKTPLTRTYSTLKPGGWLECQEIESHVSCDDGTLPPDCPLWRWAELMRTAAEKYGRSVVAAPRIAQWMKDAGYVNISNRCFKLPTNSWPKVCIFPSPSCMAEAK